MGTGFVVMAVAPVLGVAIAGATVAGVGNGMMFVASRTALQEAVEASWMALMMSLSESIIQGVPGAGFLIGGALAAASGPRAALAVGGFGVLVTGVAVWVILRGTVADRSPATVTTPGPETIEQPSEQTEPTPVIP
jgi:MFS family permease